MPNLGVIKIKIKIQHAQCLETRKCQNNQCFFRQRDVYGLCPWDTSGFPEATKKQAEIMKMLKDEYGETIFPSLKGGSIGTNCIYADKYQKPCEIGGCEIISHPWEEITEIECESYKRKI